MKNWIKVIWRMNDKLEQIAGALNKKITGAALDIGGATVTGCEAVMKLVETKRATVNMRVMYNAMVAALSSEEARLMRGRFGEGVSLSHLADEFGVGRFRLGKMIDGAMDRCIEAVKGLGVNGSGLERDYGGIHIFREAYGLMTNNN